MFRHAPNLRSGSFRSNPSRDDNRDNQQYLLRETGVELIVPHAVQ